MNVEFIFIFYYFLFYLLFISYKIFINFVRCYLIIDSSYTFITFNFSVASLKFSSLKITSINFMLLLYITHSELHHINLKLFTISDISTIYASNRLLVTTFFDLGFQFDVLHYPPFSLISNFCS